MKSKNFLSNLWSLLVGSQSSDVRLDRRLTVGSPSGFTINWTLKLVSVLVLVLTIGIGNAWGAENDEHEITSVAFSKLLNNNASISDVTITDPGYPVKKIVANCRYNKTAGGVTISITIGGESFGSSQTHNANSTVDLTFTDDAMTGDIVLSFVNNCGSGTGKGTFYLNSVTLVEGPAAAPAYTITATRNNDSYGTVSVTGTTITATPNSGYRVMSGTDGYTVTSGSATVVNNGDNTFTVTPSSNCTVQINFESKGCTDHGASSITGGALSDADHGPLHAYYDYSTSQFLYTKSDLDLAAGKKGTIKSIYFEYSGAAAMAARTIKIYMANTDLSSLTTSNYVPYASFTQVYSGTFSCGSAGWYEITLDTPFDYNGTGQLAVMIDDNTNTYESSKSFKYHSATGKQIYKRQDDTDIDPSSWTPASAIDYRPNTKFCIQEADMTPATVTLMDNSETITEVSAGAGVTLPSREGCAGYTFAGWTKTWVAPQSSWTTTAPTIISAGSYTPAADENLYPVYTKTEGGGVVFDRYSQIALGGTITSGKYLISTGSYTMAGSSNTGISFSPGTTEATAYEYTITVDGDYFTILGPDDKYIGGASSTSFFFNENVTQNNQYWKYVSTGIQNKDNNTRHIKANGTTDFRHYTSSNGTLTYLYKRIETGGSTTYYISEANCCSLQAATSVTVTSVAATSVTLGWTAPSPTTGITKLQVVDGNGTVKVDNLDASATSATVTGLTECESYTFHVVSVGASCNVSSATVEAQPFSGAKTVTYNYHEGTGSPASFTTDCSHTSTTLPTPTRANYRFDGWYDAATSGSLVGAGGASYTPSANITLHAYWTRVYTVTYNYNGGSGSCVAGGPYAAGATVTTCAAATKAGSTLTGWTRSDNSETVTPGNTFAMPASNVTLTAVWEDTPYTLTQDAGTHTTKGHTGTVITSGMTSPSGLYLTYSISDNSYALPKTVTISGGGQTWTLGTNYTWTLSADKHSATLHLGSNLTISANVTVTVAEQARYTVVWDEHGSTTTDYYAADDNTVVEKTGIADCGTKKFALWTENSSFDSHATTPPAKATFGAISGDKHYYAIYGTATGTGGYSKVTTVAEGEVYLLACPSQGKVYVGQHLTDAYGDDADVSITDNIISSKGTAHEVRIEGNASKFAIYDIDAEKYIFGPNSDGTSCSWSAGPTVSGTTNHWWNIGSGDYAGEIQGQNQTARYFSYNYNGSNHRFAAYKTPGSNNTGKVYFYKYTPGFVDYAKTCEQYDINIAATSDGTVTTTPADEAGAGQTVTVNVTPNSCKYLSALKYNDGSDHVISIASAPYTFTMPASAVTVTATFADKSVTSIAANTSTHRTLMQGTSFVGEQIRVTYNNGETEDLAWDDASLTFSGYNMSTRGNQTVSVAYVGSCGSANTSYSIEITDGIPVTYNDGNVTYVRKYEVGDIVGVDTITGKIGCSGYTFVGWSETEITSTADEYVPVHNFTATTKTLYAVYALQKQTGWMSIESADEMKSGAEYMYVKVRYSDAFALANTASAASSNYMAASIVTSGMDTWRRTSDNKDFQTFTGDAPVASIWQVIKQSTNYYLYNADAAKYLKITSSAIQLTTTPDDNFSFVDGDNDCEVMIKSSNSNYYASGYYSNPNYYFNPYGSQATSHYLLTRDSLFTTNPPCTPRSVTFHGNGGMVSDGVNEAGDLVVTETSRDAGITTPVATYEDCSGKTWTFAGWLDREAPVSRVPIQTTDLLNDGGGNKSHTITEDDEEYWAVYSSQGEAQTKYGDISFSMSDIRLDYSSTETTVTKTVTEMGDYVFGYTRLGHQSNQGIQFENGTGEFYNKTALGKINSISFTTFSTGNVNNLKVYVGDAEKATTHELTAAELQVVGSTYTYYPTNDCEYVYIKDNNAYVCVSGISIEFGKGTVVYSTTPDCKRVTLSGEIYATSRNGIGIMAVTPLRVNTYNLEASASVVITSNNSDVYFSTAKNANFAMAAVNQPQNSVTVTAGVDGNLSTDVYIHYKPSSTGDGSPSAVTISASLATPDPSVSTATHDIHVRNLPEKIVIAAKVGGAYYALPADMSGATNPEGVLIDVDEATMTATAPENCTYKIWPVKTVNPNSSPYDRYTANATYSGNAYGDRVRFSAVNNSDKGLWANNSTSSGDDTKINNNAAIASISADPAAAYEWKITTTVTDGKWSHTLQTDQSNNTKYLRYWTAASGGPKWGTYASGEQILYLLPVTEVTPFEMEVVEWYPTKVLVNTTSDLTGNTLTVRVNGSVDGDAAVTGKGRNLYEISNLDLAGNPTKSLRVDYGTSPIYSCTKAIPVIISRSTQNVTAAPFTTLTKEVYSKADLVVRDNAVLTLDGTIAENTFSSVTIYPTAKISVPSDKKLTANSLTFFGGIDDIYNGSTYTVNKYGVPELSLKGRVGKALSTINYDMRVDISQMYALALPYDVNIAAITYWDGTAMTPGTDLYISAYDGQARVNRESRTWIYEEDFEEKLGAATLKAGVGYTISAELQSGFGNEYSIIRMPMQAGLTVDATEVAKTVAVVAYVNNQGATVTDNHKGWNFVGNPYMTSISGSTAGGATDAKLIVGCLVPNTNVDPWDGSYMWRDDTYRYVTIPSDDGSENWQSKWTEVTLKPFKNFFIQVATSGDLSFALASRADAPARYMQAQEHEVEFEVLLSSEMSHDHTGLLLADKYTPAYEINADLEKMENPMSVYTLTGGYKLAYNALSPNDAKQPIPVGYIANEAGTYTFQLDERSDVNEVEHIWLTDYELDRVTDLMEAAYDFTTIVGRNETRFALTVELRSGEEIATDIGNSVDGIDNDGAVKFIWHDKMYILNQGVIYDATGKRVTEINK